MSFEAAVLREPLIAQDACSEAQAPDPATSILKHAVRIWARDHGVSEADAACLTDRVLAFARSAILDHKPEVQAVA